MILTKQVRYKSKKNIEAIRAKPCSICLYPPPSDPHHWVSKGAGGGDQLYNLVNLCHKHHQEFHNMGRETFWDLYGPRIRIYRTINGLPPIKERDD